MNPLISTIAKEAGKEILKKAGTAIIEHAPKELLDKVNKIVDVAKDVLEKIKEISPFSDKINEWIRSLEEVQLYIKEGLKEREVNDRICLVDDSIDPNLKDGVGRTNLERMKQGLPPLDENGRPYNLHHIGQGKDSPFAELKESVHRENDGILHDKSKVSEIDRVEFAKQKAEHWKARAAEIEAQMAKN
ncbi:hypothetical protein DCO58_02930 [Helicobacter saguini]|uniref:LHH domain-containing protein n=1 Tax=Helicobacter saguini TaxID=1548018 RepID=A0A347VIE8_9HELI|nr:HNH/ENDO VII family nuclease [Helicobacter saguini]MWV62670.1 hypothetical protein [Helicobacter saguini]MWV66658.1 hypothetical protein [Helicobacter saguini]MWV69008.1 hypothetical protein [Helicobacter saguini]MWV71438.1 hypothetical protein [Helicobacter saguini]TLD94087.1 hypothetical protein LS64_007165 [Helicobacter saguini]